MTDELVLSDLERLQHHAENAQRHAEKSETGITVKLEAPCAQCSTMSEIDYDVRSFHDCEHHCIACESAFEALLDEENN